MSRTNVLIVAILCLILGASIGLAQGVYLTANAGYSLSAGTQYLGTTRTYTDPSTYTSEGVYGSYGEGFKFGASAGYMFSKNLGAELGFSYWLGNTFEIVRKYANTPSNSDEYTGSGFVAVPSIVLSANMGEVNPYARFGLVLGLLKVKDEYKSGSSSSGMEYTAEQTGNLALGYAGALGIVVPVGGTVGLFGEAVIHSVTYSPDQTETIKYAVNGVDQLASLDPKVYKFKERYSSSENVNIAVRRPFSSIGFVVGVKVNL